MGVGCSPLGGRGSGAQRAARGGGIPRVAHAHPVARGAVVARAVAAAQLAVSVGGALRAAVVRAVAREARAGTGGEVGGGGSPESSGWEGGCGLTENGRSGRGCRGSAPGCLDWKKRLRASRRKYEITHKIEYETNKKKVESSRKHKSSLVCSERKHSCKNRTFSAKKEKEPEPHSLKRPADSLPSGSVGQIGGGGPPAAGSTAGARHQRPGEVHPPRAAEAAVQPGVARVARAEARPQSAAGEPPSPGSKPTGILFLFNSFFLY